MKEFLKYVLLGIPGTALLIGLVLLCLFFKEIVATIALIILITLLVFVIGLFTKELIFDPWIENRREKRNQRRNVR